MEPNKPTIQELRIAKGWKPSRLAREAEVSVFTIYRVEKGTPISPEFVARICLALGVSPKDVHLPTKEKP